MGWGLRNRVASAVRGTNGVPDDFITAAVLLVNNIVAWDGPDFEGKAITIEALDDLDPDLGDAVLKRITEINGVVADSKNSTADTAPPPQANAAKTSKTVSARTS